jgi:hypothetical protein
VSGFVSVPVTELEAVLAAAKAAARPDTLCSSGLVVGSLERWLSDALSEPLYSRTQLDAAYQAGYERAIKMVAEGE